MFGRLSRNLLLLVLEPLHIHVQDSNTEVGQFGDSFIHNLIRMLNFAKGSARNDFCTLHSGLQVPLPYLEMALRTMVDTRGEGRDGVPLRR